MKSEHPRKPKTWSTLTRCHHHNYKKIYRDPKTIFSIIISTRNKYGIELTWFKCEHTMGFHLTKVENFIGEQENGF
jgi:hypothetical protein